MQVDLRVPDDGSIIDVGGLNLPRGETLVVFGPNGAGKTTLLRALAGIGGRQGLVESHYLPQRPYLFKGPAGWNLGLGLDTEESAWAAQMAALLGLEHLLSEPAHRLSGGEAQRLALARALSSTKDWLLLDEPLAAIDHADRQKTLELLRSRLEGRSAIVVTHDLSVAAALGDHIAVMAGGRLLQQGPIGAVLPAPESAAVARILGIQNLISGLASSRGGVTTVRSDQIEVVGTGEIEGRARAVFAAETVNVSESGGGQGSARNQWSGSVTALKPLGNLIEVIVDVGQPIVAVVTQGAAAELELGPGSPVTLSVKATAVVVIPA